MGRQYLDPFKGYSGYSIDLYVPIFTILEFSFFMGWIKVAEQIKLIPSVKTMTILS